MSNNINKKSCVINTTEANVMYEVLIKTNKIFSHIKTYEELEDIFNTSNKFFHKLVELDNTLEEIAKKHKLAFRKGVLLESVKERLNNAN